MASEDKEALEAKAPGDVLKISGLGVSINGSVAAAIRSEAESYVVITKIRGTQGYEDKEHSKPRRQLISRGTFGFRG